MCILTLQEALAACPTFPVPGGQQYSALFNGMLAPFTVGPMALSGMLWYQGAYVRVFMSAFQLQSALGCMRKCYFGADIYRFGSAG